MSDFNSNPLAALCRAFGPQFSPYFSEHKFDTIEEFVSKQENKDNFYIHFNDIDIDVCINFVEKIENYFKSKYRVRDSFESPQNLSTTENTFCFSSATQSPGPLSVETNSITTEEHTLPSCSPALLSPILPINNYVRDSPKEDNIRDNIFDYELNDRTEEESSSNSIAINMHSIKDTHDCSFIVNGRFDISLFKFPEFGADFQRLNKKMSDEELAAIDYSSLSTIFRGVCQKIRPIFFSPYVEIPPTSHVSLLCTEFYQKFPLVQANFAKIKKNGGMPKNMEKMEFISDFLYQKLVYARRGRTESMKNNATHIYKYKKAFRKNQNKIVDYAELRKEKITAKKIGKQSSGRISLKEQLASALRELEENKRSSEIEKSYLLNEIDRLKSNNVSNSELHQNHHNLNNNVLPEHPREEVEDWRTAAQKNLECNQSVKMAAPNIVEQKIRQSTRKRTIKTRD